MRRTRSGEHGGQGSADEKVGRYQQSNKEKQIQCERASAKNSRQAQVKTKQTVREQRMMGGRHR